MFLPNIHELPWIPEGYFMIQVHDKVQLTFLQAQLASLGLWFLFIALQPR
jgi:hypothetical protein